MRYASAFVATLVILSATTGTAFAQRGHGNGGGAKPQTPAHVTGKPEGTPGAPAKHGPETHPATPKETGGGNPHKTAATATSKTTTSTTTSTTTVTTTTPTSTVVKNPELEQRLKVLLPGMNMADASKGFKNWGQFVAAAHVSNNLNIPFAQLKAKMTGPTPMSLGQILGRGRVQMGYRFHQDWILQVTWRSTNAFQARLHRQSWIRQACSSP